MTIERAIKLLSLKEDTMLQFDFVEVIHESENSTIQKVKKKDEYRDESEPTFYALKTMTGKPKEQQKNELRELKW